MRHRNGRVGAVGGEKPSSNPNPRVVSGLVVTRRSCTALRLAAFFPGYLETESSFSAWQLPDTSLPMAPAPGSVSTAPRLSPGLVFPLAPRSLSFWSGLLRIFARHSVSRGFSNPEDVTVWAARASAFSGRRSACLTSRLQPVRAFWPGLGTD